MSEDTFQGWIDIEQPPLVDWDSLSDEEAALVFALLAREISRKPH